MAQQHQLNTAFLNAVRENNLPEVNALLQLGANVNYRDIEQEGIGESALHIAAANGNLDIVNSIIGRNPNIDIADNFGETPLHIASKNGRTDVITALINAGANVNSVNFITETPLHLAALKNDSLDVIHKLIDNGARTDITTQDGNTALNLAEGIDNPNPEIIEILKTPTNMPMTTKGAVFLKNLGINPDNNVKTFEHFSKFLGEKKGGKRRKTRKANKSKKRRKTKKRKTKKS